jgi:CO/xanthine dehydrogenase Mo-binding subunit
MMSGEGPVNVKELSENALADKKALYKGHAIAAVAATSPHIAEEALDLIEVEYEVLPALLEVREAMKKDAPLIHENLTTGEAVAAFQKGKDTGVKSNIASHIRFSNGDVAAGFQQADVIVEREFTTKPVHQGYIELHNTTASWAPDGHLTIWTSTQSHFGIRSQTAAILQIPESMVKVIPMEIGGGFGGKINTYFDPVAAVLSKKTGHPVKMVMNRKEVFEGTGPTSGSSMRCKIGAKRDGTLTAAELSMAFESGAFPGSPVGAAAMCALAPYKLANLVIDGYDVVVNKPKVAAYRAPGAPQGAFAVETVVDEMAQKLGMDPMDLRLKNAPKEGDRQVIGYPFPKIGCIEVEQAIKSHPHYQAPLNDTPTSRGTRRGRGAAMGFWFNVGFHSSATISVNADGAVSLVTGSVDIGGTRAAIAMQAAEVLGIRAEDVIPSVGDTDSVGFTAVTGGSRTAFATGIAAITCAEEIVSKMKARAAILWETKPEEVDFKDGEFISKKNPKDRMTFKQLAAKTMQTGGPITASAGVSPRGVGPSFAGLLVDVEVDPETGKVDILRATAFQDVGQAAHPSYVEGQMQGGTAQGIGWALNEEYFYSDQGVMMNSSFLDYRMPTSLDLPAIEAVIIQVPNPGHPFGLRGVGEVSIVAPMAAVANAIHNAIGLRMTDLPMSPAAIVKAVEAKKASKR